MTIKLFQEEEINLDDLFDEINSEHFNSRISKIPCVWNKKLRVCAGKCFYRVNRTSLIKTYSPFKIEMSYKLFENNNWDMDKIKTTLAHEMTHAFLAEHHNEVGHTDHFQRIMTRITGINKNHRCHNYDVTGLRNKKKVHYTCDCGLTYGRRSRMPRMGITYRSRCCESVITFWKDEDNYKVKSTANNSNNKPKDDGDDFIPLF